jgi:hypothetical protein
MTTTLEDAILKASARLGIDPYTQGFKPSDLGINANDYGSFSDYCSKDETKSGIWSSEVILRVVEWTGAGKPLRYVLLGPQERNA